MYLIQDTLKRLYAFVGFVTVTNQLNAGYGLFKISLFKITKCQPRPHIRILQHGRVTLFVELTFVNGMGQYKKFCVESCLV